jgi:hypothetical protein
MRAVAAAAKDVYDGPLCFVGHDHVGSHGEPLEGGWHYSCAVDEEAKQIALDHAKAHVELWERRSKRLGGSRFVKGKLADAQEHLAYVEAASFEVPDRKLVLVSAPDKKPVYRFATESDVSHHEKHHEALAIMAVGGDVGKPQSAEAIAAT